MLELWVEGVSHGAGVCACDYPLISCTTNQKNEPQLIDVHQGTRRATIVWRGPTLAKITITSRSQHQREHGAKRLLEGTRPPALTKAMLSTKGPVEDVVPDKVLFKWLSDPCRLNTTGRGRRFQRDILPELDTQVRGHREGDDVVVEAFL